MSWQKVKHFFDGHPEDLIEVYFEDMNELSWGKLFSWLRGKVLHIESQYGREPVEELDINKFISGQLCYIASTKCTNGMILLLSIIDDDELLIDIEKEEIKSEESYKRFITSIEEIASIINCSNYIICPELKKDEAFIINGK